MTLAWVFLTLGLVFAAGLLGYRLGRTRRKVQRLPKTYLKGLTYLLNEETDSAIDFFIQMLEVDSETVETHLAVGKLFRQRGEVERALQIHQNLIARPQLSKSMREQALYELGHDYLAAEKWDRAERIFLELTAVNEADDGSLRALLQIYQHEKAWQNAILIANKLELLCKQDMHAVIGQFYCELAEALIKLEQLDSAETYLLRAVDVDRTCVRASLLKARIDMERKDYRTAVSTLKYIKAQNPDFLTEAIELMAEAYEALGEEDHLLDYLKDILAEYPQVPVVLVLMERIRKWRGDEVATGFVADYVRSYPSLWGLELFIAMYLTKAQGRARADLLILQGLVAKLLVGKPEYACTACGHAGKELDWLCPGCKRWSSMKPIHSLEEAV